MRAIRMQIGGALLRQALHMPDDYSLEIVDAKMSDDHHWDTVELVITGDNFPDYTEIPLVMPIISRQPEFIWDWNLPQAKTDEAV